MAVKTGFVALGALVVSMGVTGSTISSASPPDPSRAPASQAPALPGTSGKIAFDRYLRGSGDSERKAIYVIEPNGTGLRKLAKGREPRFSPNGKRIVFARRGPGGIQSIYTMSSTGTDVRRLTTAAALDNGPTWSPDGTQIVFARAKKKKGVWPPKPADLYTMNANGTNVRRLTRTPDHEDVPDWSPNGKRIAYATPAGIVTIKPNGQDKRFLGGGQPDWSPNGKRIAFNRDMQIWVMTASGKRKRALGPGSDLWANNPAWSPDGKQIAFVGFHPPGGSGEGTIGIFTMNADGTNAVQFTFGGKQGDFGLNDAFPDWQPR